MPYTERTLHPHIKRLVEEYGALNTTELIRELRNILILDEGDLKPLKDRTDDAFSQVVRNVVRTAKSVADVSSANGYIVDAQAKPAVFYAIDPSAFTAASPEEQIIPTDKVKQRQERKRQFNAVKVDYSELNRIKSDLGFRGEVFALEWERLRLNELDVDFDVMSEVSHASNIEGDGLGYDILSRDEHTFEPVYIEVKTTKGSLKQPFFMTVNEKARLELFDTTKIYRVYNFNSEQNTGDIEIISKNDLFDGTKYRFDVVTYKVTPL